MSLPSSHEILKARRKYFDLEEVITFLEVCKEQNVSFDQALACLKHWQKDNRTRLEDVLTKRNVR